MLEKFLGGLNLKQEDYSPILHTMNNGYLKYETVTPYNQKWLPRDAAGKDIPDKNKESFNPVSAWLEDRWMLCRRTSGDKICRVLFFHLCTFIWEHNSLTEDEVRECQKSLVESVYKAGDIRDFIRSLSQPVQVTTWDQRMLVWMSTKQINEMFLETCLIGPLAAMFGREFQNIC